MFILTVENELGNRLTLTQNESRYQLYSIDGLLPPKANITTSTIVNSDGVRYKSSRLEPRNIVLNIKLNGDVSENRIALYQVFKSGKKCKLYFKNDRRNVYCECVVETINGNLFAKSEIIQVSLLVPQSYFSDINTMSVELSRIFKQFEFPFSLDSTGDVFSEYNETKGIPIINTGDTETGLTITVKYNGEEYSGKFTIWNLGTREYFKINLLTLNTGDSLVINTNTGKKSVRIYWEKGGSTNCLWSLEENSTWLRLPVGTSVFWFETDNDTALNFSVQFDYNILYEGV